ncbi:unnamed protein product [Pylaiella littoralis]
MRPPSSGGEDLRLHGSGDGGDAGDGDPSQAVRSVGGGMGRATGGKPPLKVDQKELFLPHLAMAFDEDSPAFRRKVETLDNNVEGLRGHLQQLVAVARKYCGTGFAFCEHGREMAAILMNPRGESWFTRLGALAPALESLGRVLEDIHGFQEETLLRPLEDTFYPVEDFVKGEVKKIRKMKQEMRRACEDHEHSMARFLQLKRNAEESITQAKAAEAAVSKKRFEMARFDLVHHLSQLEIRKKHEVVGRTCRALYAFLELFRQRDDLVGSTEQHLVELEFALKRSREDLKQQDGVWVAKREQLEASLNKAIPAGAMSGTSRVGIPPIPSPTLSSLSTATGSDYTYAWSSHSAPSSNLAGSSFGGRGGGQGRTTPSMSPSKAASASASASAATGTAATAAGTTPGDASGAAAAAVAAATAAVGTEAAALSASMRVAHRRVASLAARLAGGVAAGSSSGSGYGAGGGADASSSIARDKIPPYGSGGGGGGGGGGSGSGSGGDGIAASSPSPVPSTSSLGTTKTSRGIGGVGGGGGGGANDKVSAIWGTEDAGGISDIDDFDIYDEDEEGEEGDGRGAAGAEAGRDDGDDRDDSGFAGGALWLPRQDRCVKGGYLWKRSTNVRRDWQRRYFFIQNGKLFYQKQGPFASPANFVCDIKLCHVKSCLKDTDPRFSFEIISPRRRTYMLQAEDEESHQAWVTVIKQEIERLLSSPQPGTGDWGWQSPQSSGAHGTFGDAGAAGAAPGGGVTGGAGSGSMMTTDMSLSKAQLSRLWEASTANPECVDCGARDPDWSSISLGVMMCIECSGIHRSMGVHVSKVRSLTLDRWTPPLMELLQKAGNENANKAWEADSDSPSFSKIPPNADRSTREAFIRSKYEHRKFLNPPHDPRPEAVLSSSRQLFDACKGGDMFGALWSLAHGADVNWANPEADGRTAAHEASRGSRVAMLELLANNGCNLGATSDKEEAPLDLAGQDGSGSEAEVKAVKLLLSKPSSSQTSAGGGGSGGGAAGAAAAAASSALSLQQQQQLR